MQVVYFLVHFFYETGACERLTKIGSCKRLRRTKSLEV